MESADFGLNIYGINKGNGEDNIRPQKVSETQEPNTEWGKFPFLFEHEKLCYFCPSGKLICDDQRLALRSTGKRLAEDENPGFWSGPHSCLNGLE